MGNPCELKPQFTESAGAPARLKGRVITGGNPAAISLDVITWSLPKIGAHPFEVGRINTSYLCNAPNTSWRTSSLSFLDFVVRLRGHDRAGEQPYLIGMAEAVKLVSFPVKKLETL